MSSCSKNVLQKPQGIGEIKKKKKCMISPITEKKKGGEGEEEKAKKKEREERVRDRKKREWEKQTQRRE